GDRAVAQRIAGDDVLLGLEPRIQRRLRREDGDPAAAQALAQVVVGVSFQYQRDALGQEAPEALAGRPVELERDRVVRQAVVAVLLRDFAAQRRADRAVDVPDRQFVADLLLRFDRGLGQ